MAEDAIGKSDNLDGPAADAAPDSKRMLRRKANAVSASGMTAVALARQAGDVGTDTLVPVEKPIAQAEAPLTSTVPSTEAAKPAAVPEAVIAKAQRAKRAPSKPSPAVVAPAIAAPERGAPDTVGAVTTSKQPEAEASPVLAQPSPEPAISPEPAASPKPTVAAATAARPPIAAVPESNHASTSGAKTVPTQSPVFSIKDMTMDMNANFNGFQTAMTDAQAKAKAAFEKSTSALGEVSDFTKGNVEAIVASGKIYAEGLQEIGSTLVAEGRTAFESMTGDIKELAAAKSPTDFLKLQSDIVRKNFDSAVAYSSKNSETMLKLLSDAFAPLSGRVSLAVEKARQVVPTAAPSATTL